MTTNTQSKQTLMVGGLVLASLAILAAIYFSPIWWVALKAPNYPPEAFPDGVRIHFHMNGVFNGCKKVEKTEIVEEVALDCVHEMDTINHYVGMYPIAAGAPVERGYSQFMVAFLGVLLLGFVCVRPKIRMAVMGTGFAAILIWMYLTMYGQGGIGFQNNSYLFAMVNALDQAAGEEDAEEEVLSPGQALIERIRKEMEEAGVEVELPKRPEAPTEEIEDKDRLIESLRLTFEADQEKQLEGETWTGSGFQVMSWHYGKTLGRYFNLPEQINPMVNTLKLALHAVFIGLAAAMVLLLFGARKSGGLFYWLLVLVPMALPVFFAIEYSAWLWWFGHNLSEMGAFTVKPFMPTVFGQGKVAQFSTHSYPYYGFGLMMLFSVVLAAAALIRRKQFKDETP